MTDDQKNKLMRDVLADARYCIPDTIVESLVKVFGQFVLDHSDLDNKTKRKIMLKALDKDSF